MPTYRKKMSIRRRKPKSKSGVVSDSVKKYVKSVTRKALPEMKSQQNANIPDTEPLLVLNGTTAGNSWLEFGRIFQGLLGANRTGNEILLQGFHSKITYFNTSTVPVYIRRLVLGVQQTDTEAGSDSAEIFSSNGSGVSIITMGNTLGAIQSPINEACYKVYYDKVIKLGPAGSTDGTNTRMVNYFQKFGGKKIHFEANLIGVLAQSHRFYELIFAVPATNDPGTNGVEFSRYNRTYFTDP